MQNRILSKPPLPELNPLLLEEDSVEVTDLAPDLALEIALRALEITLRALEIVLQALEIALQALEIAQIEPDSEHPLVERV